METQAATLRLAVFPRSSLLTDALLVAARRRRSSRCARRSRSISASRRCRSRCRPSRCCSSGLGVRPGARDGQPAALPARRHRGRAGLRGAEARLGGLQRRDRRLHRRLRRRGRADRLPRRARLGPPLLDRRSSAMLTGNVVIYVCGLLWLHHSLGVNWPDGARVRALPVRARRHRQALPRRARAPGRLEARRAQSSAARPEPAVAAPRTGR